MVKLSDIELPITFKKHLLFKAGNWNGWDINFDEVNRSVSNTKWNQLNRSLFYSHKDNEAESWIGNVNNVYAENGAVFGDVEIWDPETALKAKFGKAAFAISAGIAWSDRYEQPTNFFYRNFSIVANPGVVEKDIYLNFAAKDNIGEYKTAIFSSSLNEVSEADNTKQEVIAEQITPLEVKEEPIIETPKEEIKEEIKEVAVEQITEKLEEPIVEAPKEEILNINERRLDTSLMEEKEQNIQPVVEEKPVVAPKEEPSQPVMDDKMVETIAEKLAEKINFKAEPTPAPVTTNEFGSELKDSEEEVVERLAANLFKK